MFIGEICDKNLVVFKNIGKGKINNLNKWKVVVEWFMNEYFCICNFFNIVKLIFMMMIL